MSQKIVDPPMFKVSEMLATHITLLEHLNASCQLCRERFSALETRASKIIDEARALSRVVDQINELSDMIVDGTTQVAEIDEAVRGLASNACNEIDETINEAGTQAEEWVNDRAEAIEEFVSEKVAHAQDAYDNCTEAISDYRDHVRDQIKSLLLQGLPGNLGNQGVEFVGKVSALREHGVSSIDRLTDAVRPIQNQVQAVTQLIAAIRPVLDVARQVL